MTFLFKIKINKIIQYIIYFKHFIMSYNVNVNLLPHVMYRSTIGMSAAWPPSSNSVCTAIRTRFSCVLQTTPLLVCFLTALTSMTVGAVERALSANRLRAPMCYPFSSPLVGQFSYSCELWAFPCPVESVSFCGGVVVCSLALQARDPCTIPELYYYFHS